MIRLAMVSVTVLAALVFHVKHKVMRLAQQNQEVQISIQKTDEALHVLKAEWSHLNNPRRLQELIKMYLPRLHPIHKIVAIQHFNLGPAPQKTTRDSKRTTPSQELDMLLETLQ